MQRDRAVHGDDECEYYYHSQFQNSFCNHYRSEDNDDFYPTDFNDDFRTYHCLNDYYSTDNIDFCSADDNDDFRNHYDPNDYYSANNIDDFQ